MALQQIISRNIDPKNTEIISVGTLNAGTAVNIIADHARLSMNVRSYDIASRDITKRKLYDIADGIGKITDCAFELEYVDGYEPTINHEGVAELVADACRKHLEMCIRDSYKPARYYDAIISWFDRKYGLAVQQEWISSIPGTLAAIHMAVRLFGKPGDYVLMQTPYFTPLKAGIEGAGCRFLANPMVQRNGRYELDFDDFEEKIRRYRPSLFLLVNPHNPTGRIFTMEELTQMVDILSLIHI